MTDIQFQILIAVGSFIGAFVIILLGIIAFFIRASLINIITKLSNHEKKHEDQGSWNEEASKALTAHETMLGSHERELFGPSRKLSRGRA